MGWQTERDKLRTEMQVVFLCPTKKQQLHRTSTEPLEKRISDRRMRHLWKGSSRTAAAGEKRWETSPSTRMRLVSRWTRRRLKCAGEAFAASHRRSPDDGRKLSAKETPTFHPYPHVNNFLMENRKPRKKVQEILCFIRFSLEGWMKFIVYSLKLSIK